MSKKSTVAKALKRVLGNSYVLYVKTHAYHWNVTGPNFQSLHTLFETQYRAIWTSLDEIAERIRALDAFAPGTTRELAELATIDEGDNDVPSADGMLEALMTAHENWIAAAELALDEASEAGDVGTEDLLTGLITAHEKMRWMLRASLSV